MPGLSMETVHELGQEEATKRLKEKFHVVREQHGHKAADLVETWEGNVLSFAFKVMGMAVSGTVTVEDAAVKLDAKLPLAAMMFKGMIEREIRKELGDVLA